MTNSKRSISSLSRNEKRALLAQLLEKKKRSSSTSLSVLPHPDRLPLSFAQQRIWFFDQLVTRNRQNYVYNISSALCLQGDLHIQSLEQAVNEILQRHESFRTTFPLFDGQPVQMIAPSLLLSLPVVNLVGLAKEARAAEVRRLAVQEARRLFNLAEGPLVCFTLLYVDLNEYVLLLTIHHIIADGWSMGLLYEELSLCYEALRQGGSWQLPPLTIQYAQYALRQRAWLQEGGMESQLAYWKEQLAGAPQGLVLPYDRPQPAVQQFRGAIWSLVLDEQLSEKVQRWSQQQGVSLFMTLLAAWKIMLWQYSGQTDLIVGIPIANRRQVEVEKIIGCFVNTLALRTKLGGNLTFEEVVQRVREVTLEAYEHQDVPFERVVEELRLSRDVARNPLFQVMFALQNTPRPTFKSTHLTLSQLDIDPGITTFDIVLFLFETKQGLCLKLEYSTDLFEKETIQQMGRQFEWVLVQVMAAPQIRLEDVAVLPEEIEQQLLVEWNATTQAYPRNLSLAQLIEAQAFLRPDAIALVSQQEQITYRLLDERASQLAGLLQQQGVAPEQLVGVCLARSINLVVALLAVLKAGGAYVPLDPNYPMKRLAFMLENSAAAMVLTETRLASALPRQSVTMLCLDALSWEDGDTGDMTLRTIGPNALAYIIYTSGSTGVPKGVQITHQGLLNLVCWHQQAFAVTWTDRASQLASISFDAAGWEIWPYLATGASVWLVDEETRLEPEQLQQWLYSRAITISFLPTPLADVLCQWPWPEGTVLRLLLTGGDRLRHAPAQKQPFELVNNYGPTENSVVTTWGMISPEDGSGRAPTIGRPIANTRLYIVDEHMKLCPRGAVGELWIGGDGLARGYLNQPELTAERFAPDPFGEEPGGRLYRTGDLVRYRVNGELEFQGRRDSQVKLRGFRIELGEVENVLAQHPLVQENVVLLQQSTLVAYIVRRQPEKFLSVESLHQYLQQYLPAYMVPTSFLSLERFPLTPNGKVDRKMLLSLESQENKVRKEVTPPRTPIEETLAEIWCDLLGCERVGIHENFFALGGHSLLATRLISRLRNVFQMEVPLLSLFECPTIAQLAQSVEQLLRNEQQSALPPLKPVSRLQDPPLSFAQQRLWFLDQLTPENPGYNISCALRLSGLLHISALEQSLNEIVRRHEVLRTTFIVHEGHPKQVIASTLQLPLPIIDLAGLQEDRREEALLQLATAEAQRPFDLARGPLIRSTLLRSGQTEQVLVLLLHHIISDGWSGGVLIRELSALYAAFSAGSSSPLPELSIQYADFAFWQRNRLQGTELAKQLTYWRNQLAGMPTTLRLPTDRPRPPMQQFRGTQFFFTLPASLSSEIKKISQQKGLTLFMTLLAAYQALLFRYTGQQDIVVGVPIANRNRSEIEPLIGFFVNTLIMRTQLSGDLTVHELLTRVREVALGAFVHQDVPFERLVEELQPERTPDHSPLFQVAFALQNAPMATLELAGLKLSPIVMKNRTAKFDLTLFLWEQGDTLTGTLEYSTDLFDELTIQRMAGHFQSLLTGMVAQPEQRLADLPLLTEEMLQILAHWNHTQHAYFEHDCIHTLIEEQVEVTPDAIAVALDTEVLTYHTLNVRANQLAHYLRQQGVRPEVPVGLCLERSVRMIIGVLGILKAGGAYLPLDPEYPAERLHFMLNDARVPILLTQQSLARKLPVYEAHVLFLDTDWSRIALESEINPINQTTPANLAYIIYTSGSTGLPKGCLLTHQGLCNLTEAQKQIFHLRGSSRVLQFASASFDASVWEIFMALGAGATLCLGRREDLLAGSPLSQYLCEQAITAVTLPPSLLARLETDLPLLQTIVSAGEACSAEVVARWPSCHHFFNAYGPTETTVCASIERCLHAEQKPSIGRPIPNTQLYVLDAHLNPVPIGVPGELYIGGANLARGYLRRPHTTAERFIPHPFVGSSHDEAGSYSASEPGSRLYKTGDQVRYRPDGTLEFLGRLDQQVKLRGFRIELGEIENALSQSSLVSEVVVHMREDHPGEKYLVAYVVPVPDQPIPGARDLRTFLQSRLPEYMIPTAFVMLTALPLAVNGKVDRQHLPSPAEVEREEQYIAPRDMWELRVNRIWEELLQIHPIGMKDNFFVLGGHSLLAATLLAQLRSEFGVQLPLRTLFENATIEYLALLLRKQVYTPEFASLSPLVSIRPHGSRRPLFCIHAVGGGVLCYYELAHHIDQDQPFYGLQARGLDDGQMPLATISALAASYVEAICTIQPEGPYLLGGWSIGGMIALEMAQQLWNNGQEVALLAMIDTATSEELPEEQDDVELLLQIFGEMDLSKERLYQMDKMQQIHYIWEKARNKGKIPFDFMPEQILQFFNVYKANIQACKDYIPLSYPGKIMLFHASEQPARYALKPELWSRIATGGLEICTVKGSHYTMLSQPYVQQLAERLSVCLEECR